MQRTLTQGSIGRTIWQFSLPYLLATFLQTLYGLADVFIIGLYNGPSIISAVTIGSQVMHFLTVVLCGLSMGSTVAISRAVGAKDAAETRRAVGSTITVFLAVAAVLTAGLLLATDGVVALMQTPPEAAAGARQYLSICFAGVPFITAYNIISAIFRGLGDTKRPMVFVAIACGVNIALDFLFIGCMDLAAAGAALGTVLSQSCSVLLALLYIRRKGAFPVARRDIRLHPRTSGDILRIGLPVACQDAFIQVSFLLITIIANRRGLAVSTAVGVVEKIIGILFLVNSAMLSTVSAVAAQNLGAKEPRRARQTLYMAVSITSAVGLIFGVLCQFCAEGFVGLFVQRGDDPAQVAEVIRLGGQYLRSYVFDCLLAGVHFCFSGYFCACGKSWISFVHNLAAIVAVRVPGAYLAAKLWPETLYPMGWAAPLGSLLSALICVGFFLWMERASRFPRQRQG